jgi:tetratricopeptide (TPR) repeat protein
LEKDRNRRYETANGFAQDLRRYLADEPVQACPPSSLYRFRKFAKRCKAAIAIASMAAAGLVLTVILLAVSNRLIRQEQTRTKDERDRAERNLELAEYREVEIRQGMERLKTANALLERARVYDERQQWDDAAAAYTKAIELRPDHAPAWERRGELYARLGLWELAAEDVAKAAEMQDPADSAHWVNLALLRVHADDIPGYRRVYARMSERFRGSSVRHFNLDTIRVGTLATDFPGDPAQLVELAQAVVTAEPGEAWLHHALGLAHYRAGQYELAIERLRESPAADPNWVNCPLNYPFLAMAHFRLGQHDKARQALDDAAKFVDQWTQARYESGQGDWVTTQGAAAQWEWWNLLALQLFFREAQELMGLPPPPDDPRLHVLRARAFAGLRRNFTADVEYAAALKLRPDDPQIRLEAHRSAGYSAVARKQWNVAANEFTKASELAPDDVSLWRFRAVALVGAADMDAYRQTCQGMLQRFEKTTDSRVAGNVLLVCVLFEDALPDMATLLPLAEVAAPWGHEGAYALGKSLYRVGHYEEALKSLDTAAKISRPEAAEWSFMAMAHQQLGRADVARHCLAQAARWIDEANRQTEDDLSGTLPAWHGWHEPVVCPLLFREAEELVDRHSGNSVQNSQETDQPASL